MGKNKLETPRKKNLPLTKSIIRSRPNSTTVTGTQSKTTANIKVVVRVRPSNEKEKSDNHRNVAKIVDEKMLIFDPTEDNKPFFFHGVPQKGRDLLKRANKNLQFLFDRVFDITATNEDVFIFSTHDLITTLMDGCNCSVFVYGATGAGKTHTMLGHNKSPGITFLTMNELFKRKQELSTERDFKLAVTYLEVYNENVQDLLNPGVQLHLREDGQYGVQVQGIKVIHIEEPSELFQLLEKGNKNRTQHPTDANAESSRSHAVFQVYLQMKIKSTQQIRLAKLSMIDLAGSERGAATGCSGARFTEGANINKSLLALGNCINGLADGLRHIPYRDSKLTRLLKDSLGGNCQTVMIANISPSSMSYEDTYNTLKYAYRAKKIKSNIKKNVVNCEGHIGHYVKQVEELSKQVEELKCLLKNSEINNNQLTKEIEDLKQSRTSSIEKLHDTDAIHQSDVNQDKLLSAYAKYLNLSKEFLELQSAAALLELEINVKSEERRRINNYFEAFDSDRSCLRLETQIERLHGEAAKLRDKMDEVMAKRLDVKDGINALVQETPSLEAVSDKEEWKLLQIELEHEKDLSEKSKNIIRSQFETAQTIADKMFHILKPTYFTLRGIDKAPSNIIKEYQLLKRYLLGVRGVTWSDDTENEPPLNANVDVDVDDNRAVKRKYTTERNGTEETFVLKAKPQKSMTTNECVSKVTIMQQPQKKIAKLVSASPRLHRRPIGTMGTSKRFPSAERNLRQLGKTISKSAESVLPRRNPN